MTTKEKYMNKLRWCVHNDRFDLLGELVKRWREDMRKENDDDFANEVAKVFDTEIKI